jgi:hypothetical protein
MTVSVIEYTPETVGQMLADARARRARLYKPGPDPVRKVAPPAPKPEPVKPDYVRDWMQLAIPESTKPAVHRVILRLVADAFGVTYLDLIGQTRIAKVITPRQVAFWIMRHHTAMSFPMIGKFVGGRDHTTVLHGVAKIEDRLKHDETLRAVVNTIVARIQPEPEGEGEP